MKAYHVMDTAADIVETILTQEAKQWPWLYAERPETTDLLWLTASLPNWQRWVVARAFGPTSEFSWRRQGNGRYDLRLLTDESPPQIKAFDWGKSANWDVWTSDNNPHPTLLHGQLDTDRSKERGIATWSEARIPRWLTYPLPQNGDDFPNQVTLLTQTYAQNGIVGITRLLSVQPAPEKSGTD